MLSAILCTVAVLAEEPTGISKLLPKVSDYSANTDAGFLEAHQPLLSAPAEDAEKDAKYWAEAVGSRIKVTGYAMLKGVIPQTSTRVTAVPIPTPSI